MELKTSLEYDNIHEVLDFWKEVRSEVLSKLKLVPDELFFTRNIENTWSVGELSEHLYLSQLSVVKLIKPVLKKKIGVQVGEQSDLDYQNILHAFEKPSGRKNPENVSPRQKYPKNEIIVLLNETERKLEKNLDGLTKLELQERGFEHSILGILNLFNWIWVMSLHEYSHLISLKEKTKKFKLDNI